MNIQSMLAKIDKQIAGLTNKRGQLAKAALLMAELTPPKTAAAPKPKGHPSGKAPAARPPVTKSPATRGPRRAIFARWGGKEKAPAKRLRAQPGPIFSHQKFLEIRFPALLFEASG